MGNHTQLRYVITLAREAAQPLAPGPRDVRSIILAASLGGRIPGGFCRQSSLTAATTFQLHLGGLGPGVPDAGKPALPLLVVGQALPGHAPCGHSQGAAWQAAQLSGMGHHGDVSRTQ